MSDELMPDGVLSQGFDLDDDLDSILTGEADEVVTDATFVPDKPYWSVSREEFMRVIKAAESLPAKSTVYFCIRKEAGDLRVYVTNKDAVIDCKIPILNEDAHETAKEYFLDVKILSTLVSAFSKFVFSFDEEDKIYYETQYSQVQLDSHYLELDKIALKENDSPSYKAFPLSKHELQVFKSLFMMAVKLEDSKVLFKDNTVDAFFTLYLFNIALQTSFEEPFILRKIDIPTMVVLANSELQYAAESSGDGVDARVYIKFDLGHVSFLRLPYEETTFNHPDSFANGDDIGEISLDIKLLRRALRLTVALNQPSLQFIQEGDFIQLYAGDKAKFQVGTGTLTEEFTLTTELFVKLVATIDPSSVHVKCTVTNEGIDINIEKDDRKCVYSLSKMTTGQLKRSEKLESRKESRGDRIQNLKDKGKFQENLVPESSLFDELSK